MLDTPAVRARVAGTNAHEGPSGRTRGRPFQPGQSGNPGGRPSNGLLKELCRAHTDTAVAALVTIVTSSKEPAAARVAAATALLDRGYGKPVQAIANDGEAAFQIQQIVRTVVDPKAPT